MKWDQVVKVVSDTVTGDTVLLAIYGAKMRYTGTGAHEHPLLEFQFIADAEDELWNPCTLQFDQWTDTLETLRASERRLRRLFHDDMPTTFGGLTMWAQYVDGDTLTMPDRDGYYGRALRFRYTPLREQYEVGPTF
jgi:hypothetical protein